LSNPYVIDRPLSDRDPYYGQERLFARIRRGLESGERLFVIYGPPKVGKSSLLRQLTSRLAEETVVEIIDRAALDVPDDAPIDLLAQALSTPLPDAPGVSADLVRTVKALTDPPDGRLRIVCLDGLRAAAPELRPAWSEALESLRRILPTDGSLAVVITVAGCPPSDSQRTVLRLERLDEQDAEDLLLQPSRSRLSIGYEAVRRIHALTGDSPYLVQLFGHTLWEQRVRSGWVSLPEVEKAIPSVIQLAEPLFQWHWQGCSREARIVLCAFAEHLGTHGLASGDEIREHLRQAGIEATPEAIEQALGELESRDLLDRLGGPTYRLASDLMRRWVGEHFRALDIALDGKRNPRQPRRRPAVLQGRRIDWVGVVLWSVAVLLVGLIAYVWRSRETHLFWTTEPTPVPAMTPELTAEVPKPEHGLVSGRLVYMAKEGDAAYWSIYAMRPDGTDPERLSDSEANDTGPVCSPDGRRIAFVSDRDGNRQVYVMNADGNEQINLSNSASEDWTPTWSPDGNSLAFASFRDGNWEIYVMDAKGEAVRRLTDNTFADYAPTWSPDGRTIAFVTNRDGNLEIYVMAPDGSGQSRFTYDEATDQAPAWAPDSEQLLWETYREGNMEIYAAYLDGSEMRNLSQDAYADDHGPTWSPWDERIAFFSNRDKGWDVFTYDLATGERANITMSDALEQYPCWGR